MPMTDDQKLKSYFLGTLAAGDAERLEEECAAAAELSEQAAVVESELTDDYLRGVLSAAEKRLFEGNYLTTDARREKLTAARNLWKIAAERQTTEAFAPSFRQTLFAYRRILAFGGLAAVLLGGFVLARLNFNKDQEIVKRENTAQPLKTNAESQNSETPPIATNTDVDANAKTNSANFHFQKSENTAAPRPTAAPEGRAEPRHSTAPKLAAVFTLLPGTLRSEGEQFIKISPNVKKINLRLTAPKDAAKYRIYRAVLQTADGETVVTAPNLTSARVSLPAAKLENQTYLVLLEGQNSPEQPAESIAEYTFRVRRSK